MRHTHAPGLRSRGVSHFSISSHGAALPIYPGAFSALIGDSHIYACSLFGHNFDDDLGHFILGDSAVVVLVEESKDLVTGVELGGKPIHGARARILSLVVEGFEFCFLEHTVVVGVVFGPHSINVLLQFGFLAIRHRHSENFICLKIYN